MLLYQLYFELFSNFVFKLGLFLYYPDLYNGNKTVSSDDDRKRKNYRLIVDPFLEHGHSTKVYRFEGIIPGVSF